MVTAKRAQKWFIRYVSFLDHKFVFGRVWTAQTMAPMRTLVLSDRRRFVAGTDGFSQQSDGAMVAAQYGRLSAR